MSSGEPMAALYIWGHGATGGLVSSAGKRRAPGIIPSLSKQQPEQHQQHQHQYQQQQHQQHQQHQHQYHHHQQQQQQQQPAYLPSPMSAGSLQPTRVAAWSKQLLVTSSHATAYTVELAYPEDPQPLQAGRCEGVSRHLAIKGRATALPAITKPGHFPPAEIQSVAFQVPPDTPAAPVLGTVDSRGSVMLRRLSLPESIADSVKVASSMVISPSPSSGTVSFPRCGWAGLSFHPSDTSVIATARALSRQMDFRDLQAGRVLRSCQLCHEPSSLAYLRTGPGSSTSPVLAVVESQVLSLWDSRVSEGDGCVGREASAIRQHAWTVAPLPQDSGGAVVLATKDGSFLVFDVRAMRLRAQLRSPAKHDLLGVVMSTADPHRVYACGLDNEVLSASLAGAAVKEAGCRSRDGSSVESRATASAVTVGTVRPRTNHAPLPLGNRLHQTHTKGLRADSRWAGLAMPVLGQEASVDDLLGVSVTGTVYAIHHANSMSVGVCRGGAFSGIDAGEVVLKQ